MISVASARSVARCGDDEGSSRERSRDVLRSWAWSYLVSILSERLNSLELQYAAYNIFSTTSNTKYHHNQLYGF